MEFTFLGTSSGTPTHKRNVSALAIKRKQSKTWCLVDCGEGTQHQLLQTSYSLVQLSAIFITHVHGDHCYGLPGLLASAAMHGRKNPLKIIAPKGIEPFIKASIDNTDMYLPYTLEFIAVETLSTIQIDKGFAVSSVELSHRVPSYAYVFDEEGLIGKLDTEKLLREGITKGPLWGEIQQGHSVTLEGGRSINGLDYLLPVRRKRRVIVGGDNDSPELLESAAQSADVLIHEATYTEAIARKVGPYPQHSHSASVARFAENVQLRHLVLTHFSARYHAHTDQLEKRGATPCSITDILNEAQQFFSGSLYLAEDFMHLYLDTDGVLHKDR